MFHWQKSRIRHPFYRNLRVSRATAASGRHTVLAGTFSELEQAANRGACASHAVFLLINEDDPAANRAQRERLWTWFQVPSFVLVTDSRGRVIAFECEAQEGFHLAGKEGEVDDSPLCRCGRPGPRVAELRRTGETADALPLPDRVSA